MSNVARNVMNSLLRIAIYVRVSTGKDSQKESLKNQMSFFENYIKIIGGQLVEIYVDEGKSGTSIVKRTGLKKLMRDANQGKFDVVLVKSISRWARDTVDSISLVRELKNLRINMRSMNEGYNAFEDQGEFILTLHSAMAQQESDNTSQRIKFSLAETARRGKHHGTPPYGYDKQKGKLTPNPYQSAIVKRIFTMYLKDGWGFQKIANHLNETGIPSPRSGEKWYDTSIKCIISNPHYTGKLVQRSESVNNDNKLFLQKNGYKERIKIDSNLHTVVENTHEPIISDEVFKEAQMKWKVKSERVFRGRGKKSLFARLAFCSECGAGLNYKNDRKGYVCATYQKNGSKHCSSHFIKHDSLKSAVLNDVLALANESLNMKSLLQISIKRAGLNTNRLQNELTNVKSQLKQRKDEIISLSRALASERLTKDIYDETISEVMKEQEILTSRAAELMKLLSNEEDSTQYMQAFQTELRKFVRLDVPDEEALRDILHNLIRKVEINADGDITINYNFMNPLTGKGA